MISKIINDAKLNIIERNIVLTAHEKLQEQYEEIMGTLEYSYETLQEMIVINVASEIVKIEKSKKYDARIFQGYFLDFLDLQLPIEDKEYKTVPKKIEGIVYQTLREYEIDCLLEHLGGYSQTVLGLSMDALNALVFIFEVSFVADSSLDVFFDLPSFLESVDWYDVKTEEIMMMGRD